MYIEKYVACILSSHGLCLIARLIAFHLLRTVILSAGLHARERIHCLSRYVHTCSARHAHTNMSTNVHSSVIAMHS